MANAQTKASAYKEAGVNLETNEASLALIQDAVEATYNEHVLSGIGAFGGLFDGTALRGFDEPVLVASTDSVGTKSMLAVSLGIYDTIGIDLVNHCINDILVQGAKPLFFMDYIAAANLEPSLSATLIAGISQACRDTGTVLLGGEMAELPGVYKGKEFDLVGTVVGVVAKADVVSGDAIQEGDALLALMSGGLQTNGYTLARTVLAKRLQEPFETHTVGLELLTPHRNYLTPVNALLGKGLIKGLAHITGGGIAGNLPRILPKGLGATVQLNSWSVPAIFNLIQDVGKVDTAEMYHVFNMGAGMLVVCNVQDIPEVQATCPEDIIAIGTITHGEGVDFLP